MVQYDKQGVVILGVYSCSSTLSHVTSGVCGVSMLRHSLVSSAAKQ